MLNQPLSTGETKSSSAFEAVALSPAGHNPFPGLRPFNTDEYHLFFGREGQVNDMLVKLSRNHFLTVLGYSGSGKSSLMYCGLVPVLYGGFVTKTGALWHVVATRPGTSPIYNLAVSTVDYLISKGAIPVEEREVHVAIIGAVLRSGQNGLVDVSRMIQQSTGENVLFLVDQFEEIFRFRESEQTDHAAEDESAHYVRLILTAIGQSQIPVYAALTMRSDFLGKCSVFSGLTALINESNYLVPQMTRDQKRSVIEGPISVAGGKITPRLLKRLLADVSNDQDQLPILQHVLMRTWDYWVKNREEGEWIDIRHYLAVGGVEQALSMHANEAYEELNTREKEIAEILFKNVTEKNQDNRGMRRPVKIDLLCELAAAGDQEVISVVDHFRKAGRSFLMPAATIALTRESVVELSHESLMRIWNKLGAWVDEEFESAQMYKRLSDAAAMYQIGKTGLWRPPDLQLALNWQNKQRPIRAWAQRYDEAFERAVVFLDTSRITYEAELKNQEMMQKRALRRARLTAMILGIAAVIAILFMVFAYMKKIEADNQTELAIRVGKEAENQRNIAVVERNKADSLRRETQLTNEKLEESYTRLERALAERTAAQREALEAAEIAMWQRQIAEDEKKNATEARTVAEENEKQALFQYNRANRLLMLTKAQAMAAKSRQENDDKDLAGLLSMQAYHFHQKYEGRKYDPYIYSGLYYSLTKLDNKSYNAIKVDGPAHNRINSVALSRSGHTFFAAGADGRIFEGDYLRLTNQPTPFRNSHPNKIVALSKDERYLVNGTDSAFVQLFELNEKRDKPARIVEGLKGATNAIEFLPDGSAFAVASGDYARTSYAVNIISLETAKPVKTINLPAEVKNLGVSPDGKWLAGGTWGGVIYMINLATGEHTTLLQEKASRILTVHFSPDGQQLAYGTDDLANKRGQVKLFNLKTKEVKQFSGHNAGVFDVEFSPDGKLLASAGSDKKLQMWVLDFPEDLPIEMDNNNGFIFDIVFTADSNYLIAATSESEVRVWPTDKSLLAKKICPLMSRNMTADEWSKYVGDDIGYEYTCPGLLIKDY